MKNLASLLCMIFSCLLTTISYGQWIQIGNDIDGKMPGDNFGKMVSLSANGKIVAISSPRSDASGVNSGQVEVYIDNNGIWTPLGNAINGQNSNDQFGSSISLSEDASRLAVGAPDNTSNGLRAGHVRIFSFINTIWTQVGNDIDGNVGNQLGTSVSLSSDGKRVVLGAVNSIRTIPGIGFARIYTESNGSWFQVGQDIISDQVDDRFGQSVSISSNGKRIAVGAPNNDVFQPNAGIVKIFEEVSGQWVQVKNTIHGAGLNDMTGYTVALSGDGKKVAIAAVGWVGIAQVITHVRVYEERTSGWEQIGNSLDGFFEAISLSKDGKLVATEVRINKSRVFKELSNTWVPIIPDIQCETTDELFLSLSLSFDGRRIAIGSKDNDGAGNDAGQVRIFEQVPCPDVDVDHYLDSSCGGEDCDDQNASIHPGAQELCNGIDDDCDGRIDETFQDSDSDGVKDCLDRCPTDPNKILPLICGCNNPETDTDSDGFPDCIDSCDFDAAKIHPLFCGCGVPETDADGDGIPHCVDLCDNDPHKILPGFCGCGIPDDVDKDLDGMPDCRDRCPSDPFRIHDLDSDGDGELDCNELCDLDSGKTHPGICGCDVPDVDTDGDGVMDCKDRCPGIADVPLDNDNDGRINCEDGCPDDPLKYDPGFCGCGVRDVDTDGDGILDCIDNCPLDRNASQDDADCDGVGDSCDFCKGGNDKIDLDQDGRPDCWFFPNYFKIYFKWKCQERGAPQSKVVVSVITQNGGCETRCVSLKEAAELQRSFQLYHLGPCSNANCN